MVRFVAGSQHRARMGKNRATLWIGTSGYQYKHWKNIFYPPGTPQTRWFEHYASCFDTVEMNSTFYHLPPADTFARWGERAPAGFCYALKYSRYGSHRMHLKNPEQHVDLYVHNARKLGSHLGPILVQLPPQWKLDLPRLDAFISAIPQDLRWAFEFRHESWLNPAVYTLLRKCRAALCIHDKIADHPREITADWTYLRYHGGGPEGSYPSAHLKAAARRIKGYLARGLDVYAYFNNDAHGYALLNAGDLARFVTGAGSKVRQLQWFW